MVNLSTSVNKPSDCSGNAGDAVGQFIGHDSFGEAGEIPPIVFAIDCVGFVGWRANRTVSDAGYNFASADFVGNPAYELHGLDLGQKRYDQQAKKAE